MKISGEIRLFGSEISNFPREKILENFFSYQPECRDIYNILSITFRENDIMTSFQGQVVDNSLNYLVGLGIKWKSLFIDFYESIQSWRFCR